MESKKGNINPIGATIPKPMKEVDLDEYAEFTKWRSELKTDYEKFEIEAPEEVLKDVPEALRDRVVSAVKNKTLQEIEEQAKQKLSSLNGIGREKKEAELRVNLRNWIRQLAFNRKRLDEMIKNNEDYIFDNEKQVKRFEVEFLIEKLQVEINFLKKDAELFGLNVEEITKNLED